MISLREMQLTAGQVVGEQLDGATIAFGAPHGITIPCTHSPIVKDFVMWNGESSRGAVQACQFRAASVEGIIPDDKLKKGLQVTLTTGGESIVYAMQLWAGGLLAGGEMYQFELKDLNWGA
jgi:hypothetical protein